MAPVVVSIPGLLSRYIGFRYAGMSASDILWTFRMRDLVRLQGPIREHIDWVRAACRERRILMANRYFIGRTQWDESRVRVENPRAMYFKCNELLREPFYRGAWTYSGSSPGTILTTGAMNPLKGIFTLVEALAIARAWGHQMRLRIAGGMTVIQLGASVARRIEALQLNRHIELLGALDSEAMAGELLRSRVFALASHIENSPNALCEAMLLGTPAVAAYTGGVPDLVSHGSDGILVPPGDAALLARALVRLSSDEALASAISICARHTALQRHSPPSIVKGQLDIYDRVIQVHNHCCCSRH